MTKVKRLAAPEERNCAAAVENLSSFGSSGLSADIPARTRRTDTPCRIVPRG
jgi:hypothetical protein